MKYDWPGNIRELQNITERLILTCREDIITVDELPGFITATINEPGEEFSSGPMSLGISLAKAEKKILSDALNKYKSTRAIAKALGISQPTVVRKLHKYGLAVIDTK